MEYNFGNYAIVGDLEYTFEKEPDWKWRFKPVNSGMELEMSKFNLHNRFALGPDGVRRELPPTWLELAHKEIAMTFASTTIPKDPTKPISEGGEPIIPDGASIEKVEAVLKIMPPDMIMELWKKVGDVFPKWGPADPNFQPTSSSQD